MSCELFIIKNQLFAAWFSNSKAECQKVTLLIM